MSATLATEDVLIIETPERVPLHFALASIGNRFLACAIDHAIQGLTHFPGRVIEFWDFISAVQKIDHPALV